MNLLDAFSPRAVVDPSSYRFGTVTGFSPLRVRLDGDSVAVASSPTTLVGVSVGERVMVLLHHRRMTVIGVVGGGSRFAMDPILAPSPGSGWSFYTYHSWSFGPLVSWSAILERTGADLVSSSTGNVADLLVMTLPAGWAPVGTTDGQAYTTFQTGLTSGGVALSGDGTVVIRDANSGSTIATGHRVSIMMPPYPFTNF